MSFSMSFFVSFMYFIVLIKSLLLFIDKTQERQDYYAFICLSTNQNRTKDEKVTS